MVTAGVHGCEYVGILALQKLAETLDCATLFGQVILLPLVNSKGFFAGVKQLNPADGRNLNREFPGKADGTETQRMAYSEFHQNHYYNSLPLAFENSQYHYWLNARLILYH